ncbi:energy transducer TonB [Aquirhabdus sp.]|uniref:energy transducer TonB n=1 Tax=Aquirhabdus sp. TaxID=2824160 RepID=UPI00396CABB1
MKSIFWLVLPVLVISAAYATETPPPATAIDPTPDSQIFAKTQSMCTGKMTYPSLALRRGAEGITKLELEINEKGKMSDVNVLHSSGHVDLDQAVINFVETCTFPVPKDMKAGEKVHSKFQWIWKLVDPK